jgi:hypothetical protein
MAISIVQRHASALRQDIEGCLGPVPDRLYTMGISLCTILPTPSGSVLTSAKSRVHGIAELLYDLTEKGRTYIVGLLGRVAAGTSSFADGRRARVPNPGRLLLRSAGPAPILAVSSTPHAGVTQVTRRFKINLLAAAVIGAGGLSLSAAPATASSGAMTPCDDFRAARMQALTECAGSGGVAFQSSGSCGSEGYTLNTTCYY